MIENTKAVVLNIKQQILHLLLVMRKLEKDLANTKVGTFRKRKTLKKLVTSKTSGH